MNQLANQKDNPFALSKEDLECFSENGYMGPFPSPFPAAQMAAVQELFQEIETSGRFFYDASKVDYACNPEVDNAKRETLISSLITTRDHHFSHPSLVELFSHPAIVDRLAQILGPDLLLWRSMFFPNRPDYIGPGDNGYLTHWHQGANFTGFNGQPSLAPTLGLTVWMAITPCTSENGTLSVIPRSHRLGPIPLQNEGRQGRIMNGIAWDLNYSSARQMECAPGEFVIFEEFLVHGSRTNRSSSPRLALASRYVPPNVAVNKETWPFDQSISPDAPNPHAQGLDFPRLKYPLRDLRYDNFGLPLDNWHCIEIRGEDRVGINKLKPQ
jgi:non-heme Fe2+,alpha-ketoglutarate-dependent halogenase